MGLFDWFKAMSNNDEQAGQAAQPAAQVGGIKDESVVEGLDFVAAIEGHRKWKERLTAYAQRTSTEELDSTVICQDNQCALGKWIYGSGTRFCNHLPLFHQLKARHAQFHVAAAEIVQKVQANQLEEANNQIIAGDFAKTSRDVQTMLSKLYMQLKKS